MGDRATCTAHCISSTNNMIIINWRRRMNSGENSCVSNLINRIEMKRNGSTDEDLSVQHSKSQMRISQKCINFQYIEPIHVHTTFTLYTAVPPISYSKYDFILFYFIFFSTCERPKELETSVRIQRRYSNNKKYLVPHGNGSMCVVVCNK